MSLAQQLDDRSYDGLLAQARAVVAGRAPEWSDHGPSDPGIALLELFAWLAEQLVFRADQIPDRHTLTFVRLVRGPRWIPMPGASTADEVAAALGELRERWRAVTPRDYEQLSLAAAPGSIARARCVPRRDLAGTQPGADAPGVVSLVLLPRLEPVSASSVDAGGAVSPTAPVELLAQPGASLWLASASPFAGVRIELAVPGAGYDLRVAYWRGSQWQDFSPLREDATAGLTRSGTIVVAPPEGWLPGPADDRYRLKLTSARAPTTPARASRVALAMAQPSTALVKTVRDDLEPRRILTTRPVVVGATFFPVGFDVLVACSPEADQPALRREIGSRIEAFLDPVSGGPGGDGWPLGRSVYVAELEQLLDGVAGVDHLPEVLATTPDPDARLVHPDGDPVGVAVGAGRLPDARIDPLRIVSATSFVSVHVELTLPAPAGAQAADVRVTAKRALREYFHPLGRGPKPGGAASTWPVAGLIAWLRDERGIAGATAVLTTVPQRMARDSLGGPELSLREHELVELTSRVTVVG